MKTLSHSYPHITNNLTKIQNKKTKLINVSPFTFMLNILLANIDENGTLEKSDNPINITLFCAVFVSQPWYNIFYTHT